MALHLPTSEKVAIKIIDKSKMRPKDVQRVLKEIEVLKRIRHRHVVTLYEIMETEKSLLLVTEFLPNGELFRHIIKEKKYGLFHVELLRIRLVSFSSRLFRQLITFIVIKLPIEI